MALYVLNINSLCDVDSRCCPLVLKLNLAFKNLLCPFTEVWEMSTEFVTFSFKMIFE